MQPLDTGFDLIEARNTLGLQQKQFAAALDIGAATLRKYETSARLDLIVALAVECLLRRHADQARSDRRVEPAERARRKFEEEQELRRLRAEAGIIRGIRPRMTAKEKLDAKEALWNLKILRARNRVRLEERPVVLAQHAIMKRLAAAGDREGYSAELLSVAGRFGSAPMMYLSAYLDACRAALPADTDPLVTLPLEPEP